MDAPDLIPADGLVVNRVAESALVVVDLAALVEDAPEAASLDLAPLLDRGLVLRERPFREAVAALDTEAYAGRHVAVFCSTGALVPPWAYLLVAARLAPVAASVSAGDAATAERARWTAALGAHDWTAYARRPVVVKGCGTDRVPLDAFVQATRHLQAAGASKILYGEPCSSVPVWRAPAAARPEGVASARPAPRPVPAAGAPRG